LSPWIFDGQDRVSVGDGVELTIAAPGAVDGHDADIIAAAEGHAIEALAVF
jgi:hypothetical protein